MESKPAEEEKTAPKHEKLVEETEAGAEQTVELIENKFTKNIASPFINQSKSWDNEEYFTIPEDIQKNIVDKLGFVKPSNIQSVSIPLITSQPYHDLIAQARNGCGKTGSFAIGSTLRVNRDDPKLQVLVVVNTRELCNQIHAVYEKLVEGLNITLGNMNFDTSQKQIMVTTHGKVEPLLGGRKPMDLSSLKCLVVDEADVFFLDDKNFASLKNIAFNKQIKDRPEDNKVQFILFSATYPEGGEKIYEKVQQRMSEIVQKAQQIKLAAEKLKLNHIKQYVMKCEPKKKLDFIKDVFKYCELTQTFIFVNTLDFAEKIHTLLRKDGLSSYIMFSKMQKEERDATIEKFRKQEINVLITTNLIARGIDVPEVELVINYDVPAKKVLGKVGGDAETYLHRIGRTGRFGKNGIALTIWDRDQDKEHLDEIIKYYSMESMINELQGPDHLRDLLKELEDL